MSSPTKGYSNVSIAAWSWLAAGVSVLGLWISGINPRAGWWYGLAAQVVWTAYGTATTQPGMLALSVAFVIIYSRNLRRWRGTKFERRRNASPECRCSGRFPTEATSTGGRAAALAGPVNSTLAPAVMIMQHEQPEPCGSPGDGWPGRQGSMLVDASGEEAELTTCTKQQEWSPATS